MNKIERIKRRRLKLHMQYQRIITQEKLLAQEKSRVVAQAEREGLSLSNVPSHRPERRADFEAIAWTIVRRSSLTVYTKGGVRHVARKTAPKRLQADLDNLIGLIVWWLEDMEKKRLLKEPLPDYDLFRIPVWSPFWTLNKKTKIFDLLFTPKSPETKGSDPL